MKIVKFVKMFIIACDHSQMDPWHQKKDMELHPIANFSLGS
jgi:hypothetical protein